MKRLLLLWLTFSFAVAQNLGDPAAFRAAFLAGEVPWEEVLARARAEGEVRWFHWGGSDELNYWVETTVEPDLSKLGVRLVTSRVPDTRDAVDQVVADAAAERGPGEGAVDAVWINGENFYTLATQRLLFGAFADKLPNSRYFYLDPDDPRARINLFDNGYPTERWEMPWAQFQYTCMVDTARLPRAAAPRTFRDLETFLRANPGRFTYVRPPDYIGNTFVQSVLYAFNPDGAEPFLRPAERYTPAAFARLIQPGFAYLRRLEPFLLGGGGEAGRGNPIYPETQAANETFFVNGEVDMLCQMGAFTAAVRAQSGVFPETVENVIFPVGGMIANKSFIALPDSAPHPAAALVLANYLSSPESHASKLAALGYAPGVDLPLLNPAQRRAVAEAAPDLRGVTFAELARLEVPDTNASLIEVIQEVWVRYISEGSEEPFREIVREAFAASE